LSPPAGGVFRHTVALIVYHPGVQGNSVQAEPAINYNRAIQIPEVIRLKANRPGGLIIQARYYRSGQCCPAYGKDFLELFLFWLVLAAVFKADWSIRVFAYCQEQKSMSNGLRKMTSENILPAVCKFGPGGDFVTIWPKGLATTPLKAAFTQSVLFDDNTHLGRKARHKPVYRIRRYHRSAKKSSADNSNRQPLLFEKIA